MVLELKTSNSYYNQMIYFFSSPFVQILAH